MRRHPIGRTAHAEHQGQSAGPPFAFFGLVGTIGLDGAWLYVATGAGLLALALLIMEPEHGRTARPSHRLGSQAVSTTVNRQPPDDREKESLAQREETQSPSRRSNRTRERRFRLDPDSAPANG